MEVAALEQNQPLVTWSAEFPSNRELFARGDREWSWSGAMRFLSTPYRDPRATAFFHVMTDAGAVCDSGDIEDALIVSGNVVAAFDACSSAYKPGEARRMLGGIPDGQFAALSMADFVRREFNRPLVELLLAANANLGTQLETAGFTLHDAGALPGVSGAAAQFWLEHFDVCQTGDGIVVVKFRDGTVASFQNQSYTEDVRERAVAKEILGRRGSRKAMWEEFAPLLQKFRTEVVNNPDVLRGYGNFNGQTGVEQFVRWQRFRRCDVAWLLVATDGIVPFDETENPERVARYVGSEISRGGLPCLYASAKRAEADSPRDHPFTAGAEKTAIFIEF